MKGKYVRVAIAGLVLALPWAPTWAQGWYIGGGWESVAFEDDLEDIDTGGGPVFSFGYGFNSVIGFDGVWGGSIHDENLGGGEAVHGNLLVGVKLGFGERFKPFVTMGLSGHAVDFDFFEEITGGGTYLGFGADIFVADRHAIGVGWRSSTWDGEDSAFDYEVTTRLFTIVYNYHFPR